MLIAAKKQTDMFLSVSKLLNNSFKKLLCLLYIFLC